MRGVNTRALPAGLVLALWGGSAALAATPIDLEARVVLRVEALTVTAGRSNATGVVRSAEIGPTQQGAIDLTVPWGGKGGTIAVHLVARMTSVVPDGDVVLMLTAESAPLGERPVVASREVHLGDEGSSLFEVFGDGDRRLLLTLQGERVTRAVVRPPPSVGAPVRLDVAILRIDGERTVPLETNELHTFVGQSVEYSFRLGQGDGLESVRLTLLPVTTSGDLVTLEAEISGALPGASGTVLLSHTERIVASRRATSSVEATTGTPPAGYRFQVTPDF